MNHLGKSESMVQRKWLWVLRIGGGQGVTDLQDLSDNKTDMKMRKNTPLTLLNILDL